MSQVELVNTDTNKPQKYVKHIMSAVIGAQTVEHSASNEAWVQFPGNTCTDREFTLNQCKSLWMKANA